jgi:AcrR family transcriptional regulator
VQLLDRLATHRLGERPLLFVSHSMGGIIAKQLLRHANDLGVPRWQKIATQTRGIAFIATPHSGANLANFATFASAIYRTSESVKDLAAHHPRLRELHNWFRSYYNDHGLVCRTYCESFEVRPELLGTITLPKGIVVVDQTSAEPNLPGEVAVPLQEDHISICKPKDRSAQLYESLLDWVRECSRTVARQPLSNSSMQAPNGAVGSPITELGLLRSDAREPAPLVITGAGIARSDNWQHSIARLIKASGRLTSRELAEEAGINRGQLNNWLNGKRALSDDRARIVGQILLKQIKKPGLVPAAVLATYAEELDALDRFLAGVSAGGNEALGPVPVDAYLPAGHPAFCKRQCEEDLEQQLAIRPFTLGIRGGRKTGKSTAARWLAARLKSEGPPLLYFELSPPEGRDIFQKMTPADLFAWLDQQARDALPDANLSPLRDWRGFVPWVGENLLRYRQADNRCASLFFDGIENLSRESQDALFIALHSLRNAKARDPNYRFINLLCAFDPGRVQNPSGALLGRSGSILFNTAVPRAGNIPQGALVRLVEWRLGLAGHERNQVVDRLWSCCAGHPWLTQVWLNTYDASGAALTYSTLDALDRELADRFFDPKTGIAPAPGVVSTDLVRRLASELGRTQGLQDRITAAVLPDPRADPWRSERGDVANWSLLSDTGLFAPGEDPGTLCCTRWIAERLVEQHCPDQ